MLRALKLACLQACWIQSSGFHICEEGESRKEQCEGSSSAVEESGPTMVHMLQRSADLRGMKLIAGQVSEPEFVNEGEAENLTIMMEAAYPPFNNFDGVNGLVGFDVELLPLVCNAAGITCNVVVAPFKNAWPGSSQAYMGVGFKAKQFDCVMASGNTFPRRATLKFSNPYTEEVYGAFVGMKRKKVASPSSPGVRIGVVVGFSCGMVYAQTTYPSAKVSEFHTVQLLFQGLSKGTIDLALTCPIASAADQMNNATQMIVSNASGFNKGLGFMCRPGIDPMIAKLNTGLKVIQGNGQLRTLCAKYPSIKCEYSRVYNSSLAGVDGASNLQSADVTIMMEAAYAPFNNYDPVLGLVGFDVELLPPLCQAAGFTCALVTAPFSEAWPGSSKGFMGEGFLNSHFDCVMASGNTADRSATLKFSDPYTQEVMGALVANKGTSVPATLTKLTVGTVASFSCSSSYVLKNFPNVSSVTEFKSVRLLFAALKRKRVQVALTCPIASALQSMSSTTQYIAMNVTGFNRGLAFMCHPEAAPKIAKLNSGLKALRSNGKLRALCSKYPDVLCDFQRTFNDTVGGITASAPPVDVTIMMEAAYPPFNNFSEATGLVGFDVEFLPLVCKSAGLECAVVTADFSKAWPGHQKAFMGSGFLNNHFDCVMASGNTFQRRATLKFSDPYTQEVRGAFVTKKGAVIPADLSKTTVGTVAGFSCGSSFVNRTYPKAGKITEFSSVTAVFDALSKGLIKTALTCPIASATKSMNNATQYIAMNVSGFNDGLAFMCHPGSAVQLSSINAGIRAVQKDGSMASLCAKYPSILCESGRRFNITQGGVAAGPQKADIIVMMEAAYPPFSDFDDTNGLTGFDVELLPLVCAAASLNCVVVTAPFTTAWPGVEKGSMGDGFLNSSFDCVSGSGNTMERRSSLRFSSPYTEEVHGAFVVQKSAGVSPTLTGVAVGTIKGYSCGKSYVLRNFPNVSKVSEFSTPALLIKALEAGTVKVALTCPIASAQEIINEDTQEIFMNVSGFNEGLAFMCHPQAAGKLARINAGIDAVRSNGAMAELCSRYPTVKCEFKRQFNASLGGVGTASQDSGTSQVTTTTPVNSTPPSPSPPASPSSARVKALGGRLRQALCALVIVSIQF